jgi:SNF2 family DNA or RNA helicase
MRLLKNTGNDRVIDELRRSPLPKCNLDVASPVLSLFALGEVIDLAPDIERLRLAIPRDACSPRALVEQTSERTYRNRLEMAPLAQKLAKWLATRIELRTVPQTLPQSLLSVASGEATRVIIGHCPFDASGIGLAPGDQFGLVQCAETSDEAKMLASWFEQLWANLPDDPQQTKLLIEALRSLAAAKSPSLIYHQILFNLFKDLGEISEERIIKSATGINDSVVWKKLFRFQRDGVIGAIDKLERYGGCIIADSVGLGKTFEALAVIKYYELRNDRVLVLCPKRLRDNWTLYKSNDKRNSLAADRLHYDVLNHTDLSRDGGVSGDIDLSHVNWGNYDLVVIDESHNFRNKPTHKARDSRYDRLMQRTIKAGVKTRVLMLSATPVNNRLADLKNQIAFVTEGNDTALTEHGIASIEATTRLAQKQFNTWLKFAENERRPARLIDMLGFDYFKLLDLLTIARSRKHIEKYYGVSETGQFPERLKPINVKADVDRAGEFRSIKDVNNEIRRLNLSAYAPLKYVLPHKQAAYDAKYSTKLSGGDRVFKQIDREQSMIHLLRVNLLKRMESAVTSFALTLERQLTDVEAVIARLDAHDDEISEIDIDDIEIDDPEFEPLLVGRNVKVLVQDVDRVRWRQDLEEDRDRLTVLLEAARQVLPARDDKLDKIKELIAQKVRSPINPGNRKVIVFTAFADTAQYLYKQLANWAATELGVQTALVTGAGSNRTTLPKLRTDLASILTAFSPRSKERPAEAAEDGDLDLLIATDCISEGQNIQDCDYLINYDIHWNPVRIIQRFGRIDRIGSPNKCIQLVNFWPNIQLEEYINLEQRVSGRMVLLDVSATGEENIIGPDDPSRMNDLEYRRKQLMQLQDKVIDLEDISTGLSIADLTLNDFRMDLANYIKERDHHVASLPMGSFAVTTAHANGEAPIPPGLIFCLRAVGTAALKGVEEGYPLKPHYLVYVAEDGTTLLPYTQAKHVLDRMKKLCLGREEPLQSAIKTFDQRTRNGQDMGVLRKGLSAAVASITGKKEERAVASLFSPGGTHAQKGEFAGVDDFEVVAFLVVLADEQAAAA